MLLFTRTGAGYCPICECNHVNNNTHFSVAHDQCRHLETHCSKKTTLVLGYLDLSCANGLRRAMSITADKIPKAFEQQNINNRAVTPLKFGKAKGVEAPDTLLIKSPMGTSKTKALVDYLKSDQVAKDARVTIISFCKSFASEMYKNIQPNFVDYQPLLQQIRPLECHSTCQ